MSKKQIIIRKTRQTGMTQQIVEQAKAIDAMPPMYTDVLMGGYVHLRERNEQLTLCGLENTYRPVNYGHLVRCPKCQEELINRQLKAPYIR